MELVSILVAFAALVVACATFYYSVARTGRIVVRKLEAEFGGGGRNLHRALRTSTGQVTIAFMNNGAKLAGFHKPTFYAVDADCCRVTLGRFMQDAEFAEGGLWLSPYTVWLGTLIVSLQFPDNHEMTPKELAAKVRRSSIKLVTRLKAYEGFSIRRLTETLDLTEDIARAVIEGATK